MDDQIDLKRGEAKISSTDVLFWAVRTEGGGEAHCWDNAWRRHCGWMGQSQSDILCLAAGAVTAGVRERPSCGTAFSGRLHPWLLCTVHTSVY